MHELSVAQGLVELVADEVARDGPVRVLSVQLRIGPLSGVEPSALLFAYDAATAGTPLDGSALHIEEVPATVFCEPCGVERELVAVTCLRCPACGAATPNVVRGRELEVVSVEVADLTEDVVTATAR